mmetsp:Transcript_34313/g.50450  ORF Transcript_34313/g.50450 Transcript_34313/m.50450 type:complete len:112 (-) Transcript_34313:25-360(-)
MKGFVIMGSVFVTHALVDAQHLKQQKNSKKASAAPKKKASNPGTGQYIRAEKLERIRPMLAISPMIQPHVRGSLKLMSLHENLAPASFTAALPTLAAKSSDILTAGQVFYW